MKRTPLKRKTPLRSKPISAHPNWKGDDASDGAKRQRARKLYPDLGLCEADCGRKARDRHHRDGDPGNNSPENVVRLCRRCHMTDDGRIVAFRATAAWNTLRRSGREQSCANCRRRVVRLTGGRCHTCDMFWRRTGRERDPEREREEAVAWWRAVAVGRKCAVCGTRREIQGHHIIKQQRLRSRAADLGVDPVVLLWDPRVGMALCHTHHAAFEARQLAIAREDLPPAVEAFAREWGLGWSIERDYLPRGDRA